MESGGSVCRNGQSSDLCLAHFIGAGVKNPSSRVLKMCTQVKELTPVLGVEGWAGGGGSTDVATVSLITSAGNTYNNRPVVKMARACRASVVRTVPYWPLSLAFGRFRSGSRGYPGYFSDDSNFFPFVFNIVSNILKTLTLSVFAGLFLVFPYSAEL